MKKLLSIILVFALALGLTPAASASTDYKGEDDIAYSVQGGNIYFDKATGRITAADESITSANIPAAIDGVAVKTIGGYAFANCQSLTSINIPNSVTAIEDDAFYDCTALTDITLPNSITAIGGEAVFAYCTSLTDIIIPNSVTTIGHSAFFTCTSLKNVTIPDSVITVGDEAFSYCDALTNIFIPDGVTTIGYYAFIDCPSLTSITIPASVTSIGHDVFWNCPSLTDIYFGGTEAQWTANGGIDSGYDDLYSRTVTVHYNSYPTNTTEYVYDTADPAENMTLPTDALETVDDTTTAASAVGTLTSGMTAEQKASAVGIDLATLYAETAVSKAASKEVSGSEIIIDAASVNDLEAEAANAAKSVETALINGGVSTGRYISNTVTLTTNQTGKITIKVDPDILTTEVDKIRVETPNYALTLKVSDLEADLKNVITISAESTNTTVTLNLPGGRTTNPVTLSFPSANSSGVNEAVVNESGAASTSKYNPATVTMDGKINTSGKYTVKSNAKDFTDIASKSAEMQRAIRYLASKGIINGTSETTFSPDGSISRAEIAALVVRALGKLDSTAAANFTDVTTADWYYSAAASSQKHGIIKGYTDNTFKGKKAIVKQEIVAVAARVLKSEMNYKDPANAQTYLAKYSDTVPDWARPEVALATRENLIVYRVDGTFSGAKDMTRGDAAIIIYRMFQHIW